MIICGHFKPYNLNLLLSSIKNRLFVPADFAYGGRHPTTTVTMLEVLRECPPCKWKDEIRRGIAHLNCIRVVLRRREDFQFPDVLDMFKAIDNVSWE